MHASYGLVKTRLICYVGKVWMFTRIRIRIIPVVTSAHLHIRIVVAVMADIRAGVEAKTAVKDLSAE